MPASYRLRRFSNIDTLKRIEPELLADFLRTYEAYLGSLDLRLPPQAEINYDRLAAILSNPNEGTPEAMLDALFFVDEVSMTDYFDDLREIAAELALELSADGRETAADLAVRIWLVDPERIQRLHAERFLTKAKSFDYFLNAGNTLPELFLPADAVVQSIVDDLNDWYQSKKRGRGARVFPVQRDSELWFLVRHGEPYKREGTIENGESASAYFRPEKFDVLIYNSELGELAIHAGTKGEKQNYCRVFGRHLFGSASFFNLDAVEKFTLAPIIRDGRASVAVTDIDGIEEIRLSELQFRHESGRYHVEIHKSDDVFRAMADINREVPAGARLLRASFKVKFRTSVRPRTVVIRPPNITVFDRESDAAMLQDWMVRRGFILNNGEPADADADAVLVAS